jgi:chemotaxis protein methyltransferase CheR
MSAALSNPAGRPPSLTGLHPISRREFALFQELIERVAGISLGEHKQALLVGRLARRLRALQLDTFEQYYDHVTRGPGDELVAMLNCICTHETRFFREPRHFQLLEESVYPQWEQQAHAGRRPRRIRIWSAASSSGEEPYSLAMSALARFPKEQGWSVEVLASDLSTQILERARAGVWPLERARDIPTAHLQQFMLRGTGTQEGLMKVGPELAATVRFLRVNLNDPHYPIAGPFDLVFCRNVLIYFAAETRARVVQELARGLGPEGLLFLGHSETLPAGVASLRMWQPTVYGHRSAEQP